MGLKIFSKQFRDSVLQLNLKTPPDVVNGLSDLIGAGAFQSYFDALGKDAVIKVDRASVTLHDPGNVDANSVEPRRINLARNLNTPNDVIAGIKDLTPSAIVAQQYLAGRGEQTQIHNFSVINPGSIDTYADVELTKLLKRNISRNQNDPSQSDDFVFGDGYSYSSLVSGIGKPTTINEYNVRNLASVTNNPNITPETQLQLSLQQNRYMPTEPNRFEVVVNLLESHREPYVNLNTGMFSRYQAGEYTPSQFIGGSTGIGTISQLSTNTKSLLKTDTLMMNIAAMELKFNFENRILNAIERETIGKTFIDEALTNPLTAIQILQDPLHNLFERNWEITVGPNAISKAALLTARLAGLEIPVSILPNEPVFMPGNYSNVVKSDWDEQLLKYTGGGQKFALQTNLSFNKYTPIFSTKRNAGYYIGETDPKVIDVTKNFDTDIKNEMSSIGSIETDFAWIGKSNVGNENLADISSYSKFKSLFKPGSLMDVTQKLLDSTDDGSDVAKSAIDQTKRKLDDGFRIISKGSGVLEIGMTPPTTTENGSRNKYEKVPNRKSKDEMKDANFCRVWTKNKPYKKITDSIRFKGLIRKERNSVIDDNGNYNIFPSQLNVNEGYGRTGDGLGDATVEAFGERRARKYMFSLENLAWRDSKEFVSLPACEKGSNNGRIMWFPPYDIKFSDDSSANYTTHQFLGRPEPIYTFNNTERSGNLSFKIVVDHPTILNTLVKHELASLSDNDVDEILASFWSGCLEYDVFELARVWGVLTDIDIAYFKDVIADIQPKESSATIAEKAAKAINTPAVKDIVKPLPVSSIQNQALYFENDVPFPTNAWSLENFNDSRLIDLFVDKNDMTNYFKIKPFSKYFETYKTLSEIGSSSVTLVKNNGKLDRTKTFSAAALKSVLYPDKEKRDHYASVADDLKYSKSIGKLSGNDYFGGDVSGGTKLWGFSKQMDAIAKDISDPKYNGYDLTIDLTAFSSPINPSSYNEELAKRRYQSVAMWIAAVVLEGRNPTLNNETKLTVDNVLEALNDSTFEFKKNGIEKVTINRKSFSEATLDSLKNEFTTIDSIHEVVYDGLTYKCDFANRKPITDLDGRVEPGDNVVRRMGDLVCSDLSIIASRSRRVDIKVTATLTDKTTQQKITEKNTEKIVKKSESITKREIVQRLLNKFVNECDYFDYIRDTSPTVYNSIREKLKYFQPAFHAMTPEGLNARLTFLQQCLRPGETIKSTSSCTDAVNTSFGKPPICILRIGDFYNTKIVINSLNISYDPLLWDLNPEGIGAQPMLADVNISFKYIGGSGLRKYVDQLQNALSFNYYANTDMYDDRTFANTNAYERNLINLEEDFFNGDSLDLEKIITLKDIVPNLPEDGIDQATLIGNLVKTELPYLVKSFSEVPVFIPDTNYGPGFLVKVGNEFFERTDKLPESNANTTNTTEWKKISITNYGEEAYLKEYGATYISLSKVSYQSAFKNMYESYVKSLGSYIGMYKNFLDKNVSPVMLNFIMKQKYGPAIKENTVSTEIFAGLSEDPTKSNYQIYEIEAKERNYKMYHEFGIGKNVLSDDEVMKLHLYPQDKFYRMNNGLDLNYPTDKFNPGALKSIYLKDKSTIFDNKHTKEYFDHHVNTLMQKIDHDMVKFLNESTPIFNDYVTNFIQNEKQNFRTYLKKKLSDYVIEIEQCFEATATSSKHLIESITKTSDQINKLSIVLDGCDALGSTMFVEVVPNGTVINDVVKVFGYDPYITYPMVQYKIDTDNAEVIKGNRLINNSVIEPIMINKSDRMADYIRLGNGAYFFRQVATSSQFVDNSFNGDQVNNTNLPYIPAFDQTIGEVKYRQNTGLSVQWNGSILKTEDYSGASKMTSTFEKLNYEMFDFSNKTLSIMVNDTISDTTTTFDTQVVNNSQLSTRLKALLTNTAPAAHEQVVKDIIGPNDLYSFNFVPVNASLISLNDKLTFKFTMTEKWRKEHNSETAHAFLDDDLSTHPLEVNYYDELLMLGFYERMLSGGVDNLINEFKTVLNVATPYTNTLLNPRQQKDDIKNRVIKRTAVASQMVNELKKFVTAARNDMKSIETVNSGKLTSFSENIRKILFNEDSNVLFCDQDYPAYAEKMLKKVDDNDYILMMRQRASTSDRTKTLLNKLYN